jgi:DNA repair protein RadD
VSFVPRPYQNDAIEAGVNFFKSKKKGNGLLICPTGSGKSLIIACIASKLEGNTVVFQPSKEILQQNLQKFTSYGYRASVYSASAGMKYIDKVTFATIGSVASKKHLFKQFQNIIIDEAHCVNAEEGQYHDFIKSIEGVKVLGLTATPYRLTAGYEGAMLKFLTRTRPKIFNQVLYYIQNDILFNSGYLAKLEYFSFNVVDRTRLELNAKGTDFTDASLKSYYRSINMPKVIIKYARMILSKKKNLMIFCSLIDEAFEVSRGIPGSIVITGKTDPRIREKGIANFKSGAVTCVINVGVFVVGFDYPGLEAVLMGRSTMSLAMYYQILGRVLRTHPDKQTAWFVDLGGNVEFFGKVESMQIMVDNKGLHYVCNNGKRLTNVAFSKK